VSCAPLVTLMMGHVGPKHVADYANVYCYGNKLLPFTPSKCIYYVKYTYLSLALVLISLCLVFL
jgi:hypothetical protein